jgi:hypothetical protein
MVHFTALSAVDDGGHYAPTATDGAYRGRHPLNVHPTFRNLGF